MKLEITFEELNAVVSKQTKCIVSVKPIHEKDAFQLSAGVGIVSVPLKLYFDKIVDGHQVVLNYKMPLGMNMLIGKIKEEISSLIPGRIVEIDTDCRQITVYLTRIESMERYFEHFEVSHFEIIDQVIQIKGELKE